MKDVRVVAVLSGGGAKAAAHIGALEALREHEITPAHYVGTSMGAVIAACFAAGLTYPEILRRITTVSRSDVAQFSAGAVLGPFASSLFKEGPLRETIRRLVPVEKFEDFEVPLTVTAVDLRSGELVLFGSGGRMHAPVVDALYASCALPLYYPPGRIGDRQYIDGGMRSVLPLDVAGDFDPDLIFAVDAGPSLYADPPDRETPQPAMVKAHGLATRILMATQTEAAIARWKAADVPLILVRPTRDQQSTFSVEHVVRYVEEGYRAGHVAIKRWLEEGGMRRQDGAEDEDAAEPDS